MARKIEFFYKIDIGLNCPMINHSNNRDQLHPVKKAGKQMVVQMLQEAGEDHRVAAVMTNQNAHFQSSKST